MTLVAPTTSSAAESSTDRTWDLQRWALTRDSIQEHLHAIELVLTHDFDEPSATPDSRRSRDAQRDRELFLIDATGLASEHARPSITFIGSALAASQGDRRIAA